MKKFIPASPDQFRPLTFPRHSPQELRARVFKQPALLALPSPKEVRVMAGLLAFVLVLV